MLRIKSFSKLSLFLFLVLISTIDENVSSQKYEAANGTYNFRASLASYTLLLFSSKIRQHFENEIAFCDADSLPNVDFFSFVYALVFMHW